jgi:hypothetical protein
MIENMSWFYGLILFLQIFSKGFEEKFEKDHKFDLCCKILVLKLELSF